MASYTVKDGDRCLAAGNLAALHALHSNGVDLSACSPEAVHEAIKHGHWAALHFWFQAGGQIDRKLLARTDSQRSRAAADSVVARAHGNLAATLAHPANRDLPAAGPRWQTYAVWARLVAAYLRSPADVVRFAQHAYGHGGFESRFDSTTTESYAADLERHLAERFPQFRDNLGSFDESDLSDPDTTAFVGGRRVSAPLYANMTFFLECHARLAPYPQAVCEIGGGYGGPARIWLTNTINRPRRYVILDLPESLFFAEVFLRTEFGADAVHYVSSPDPVDPKMLDEAKAVLCPTAFHGAIRHIAFDLAYNTLSMQEMSEAYVAFYSEWLDRMAIRHFYSFNYAGQPSDQHPESANWGVPRLSRLWHPVWVAPYAAGPSPGLHVLARKHDGETAWGAYGQRIIGACLSTPFDSAVFTLALMAARLANDASATCAVLRKALTDFDDPPREMKLLTMWLPDQNGWRELSMAERGIIQEAISALTARGDAKAMAAPYLETIRQDLAARS